MNEIIRLNQIDEVPLQKLCNNIIGKAVTNMGTTMPIKELGYAVIELTKDLQKRFPNLCKEEIEIAFDNGVRGDYGEFFGLNIKTFNQWLKGYIDSGEHAEYLKTHVYNAKQIETTSTITKEEKIKWAILGIVEKYKTYLETNIVKDYGNTTYKFLWFAKLIEIPQDYEDELMERAGKNMIETLNKEFELAKINQPFEAKKIGQQIDNLVNKMISDDLVSEAKTLAVQDYFDGLKLDGITVEQLEGQFCINREIPIEEYRKWKKSKLDIHIENIQP